MNWHAIKSTKQIAKTKFYDVKKKRKGQHTEKW